MLFTIEDKILIKHCRMDKNMAEGNYEFPNKPWSESGLDKFITNIILYCNVTCV